VCGRFVAKSDPAKLAALFKIEVLDDAVDGLGENYNVAPSQRIAVVDAPEGVRTLDVVRWGLLPSWAKEPKIGARMINARAETVDTKPAYRHAFKAKRCLVPADGFYEWKRFGTKLKQPSYFHRAGGDEPLAFAGLWEIWRDKADPDAAPIRTACIVTTSANATMAPVHDRMPVILPASAWDAWLDPGNHDTTALKELLQPAPGDLLDTYPVARAVGNVRNNGPHLLDAAPPEEVAEVEAAAAAAASAGASAGEDDAPQ